MLSPDRDSDDQLLTPREAAEILGVRTTTIARWARHGRLKTVLHTPGGHRRYRRADITALRGYETEPRPEQNSIEQDAVRLYEQGWPIRRVADEFGFSYGKTRRILLQHTALRRC